MSPGGRRWLREDSYHQLGLRPLFQAFFGEDGVQTQAPSNKAARQIHGKTTHTANKLQMDASLRTVHLRLTANTRKTLERSTTPLGAMILDEFSQCIGQMLHADALRKTYGRQSACNLEVHKYAEPLETWGRTPVVVIAGVSKLKVEVCLELNREIDFLLRYEIV